MQIRLKINKSFGIYNAGNIITVDSNAAGIPLEKFWRNRLRDSKVDGCVEVVNNIAPSVVKKSKSQESA